jgi:glyoxylase-like metal-dependent hydrolase (beta-lactamase superfamily II)
LHEYLDGLRRLVGYRPRLVLPAHGRPFEDAATRVDTLMAHHHRRLEQVREIVAVGELTAWEVALELWGPRQQLYEKRLALQEGLAHLQALAVEGVLEKSVSPERVSWRLPRS